MDGSVVEFLADLRAPPDLTHLLFAWNENTVSFTDLNQGKMIIFESILTIFETSTILGASGTVAKRCLSLN
jgi:hypothetical protein